MTGLKKPSIAFWAYLGTALILILLVCYIAFPVGNMETVPAYSYWEEDSSPASFNTQPESTPGSESSADTAGSEAADTPEFKPSTPAGKVNLNTAGKEELCSLDGIGEVLAGRIIEYRNKNGGFTSIEQLQEVSGIGEKRFAAVKDHITV